MSTASVPIASVLPSPPGCALLVSPGVLDFHLPAGGALQSQLAIPPVAALVGQVLHEQVVGCELGVAGGIAAVTGSNALSLTFGAF